MARSLVLGEIQHDLAKVDVRRYTGESGLHRNLDWVRGVHRATGRLYREQAAALSKERRRAERERGSGGVSDCDGLGSRIGAAFLRHKHQAGWVDKRTQVFSSLSDVQNHGCQLRRIGCAVGRNLYL